MKSCFRIALVAACAATLAPTAFAGFAFDFVGTTPGPGGNTTFTYNVIFTTINTEERLTTGSGMLAPGVVGSQDFITLYDITGFVSATVGAGFSVQAQNVGVNGPWTAPPDSPSLVNVTMRYSTADISVNTTFVNALQIVSTQSMTTLGFYSSQRTDNEGQDINQKIGEVGTTAVPVPEPATFAILGLGALGVLRRRRRKI